MPLAAVAPLIRQTIPRIIVSLACAASVRAATLGAQSLPVQSVLGTTAVSGCSATPAPAPVNGQVLPAEVRKTLVERAQDASLQGDHVAARDAYVTAAASALSDGRVA